MNRVLSLKGNMDSTSSLSPSFMMALLANILWGASFLASKHTLMAWGPFTASALRFGLASIFLFVALALMGKSVEIPKSFKGWLGLGVIGTAGFGLLFPLQLAGLKYIPSSVSAAIMLTSPLMVLMFGKTLLNEKLSRTKWIALTLGIVGGSILLFSTKNSSSLELSRVLCLVLYLLFYLLPFLLFQS